jgi:hypothetical protein
VVRNHYLHVTRDPVTRVEVEEEVVVVVNHHSNNNSSSSSKLRRLHLSLSLQPAHR